jgi:hypothetical protein
MKKTEHEREQTTNLGHKANTVCCHKPKQTKYFY